MVLGITGISGSGKHVAAEFFAQRGWTILDVDEIAHYLYRPYTHVWKGIVKYFGEGVLTQNDLIDRQKLSKLVFDEKNPEKSQKDLKALNAIVHPAILHHLEEKIHRHFRRQSNVAIVAALLQEIGLSDLCDAILLMKTAAKTRMERICLRDSISQGMYRMRAQAQTNHPRPDFVVENNGNVRELYAELNRLQAEWAKSKEA